MGCGFVGSPKCNQFLYYLATRYFGGTALLRNAVPKGLSEGYGVEVYQDPIAVINGC